MQAGDTVAPNLQWAGFGPGTSSSSTIEMSDFFDCSGAQGIDAVLVIAAAQASIACIQEAGDISKWLATTPAPLAANWSVDGVVVITLLMTDPFGDRATVTNAQQWLMSYGLESTYVLADPGATFDSGATETLPANFLIDPRTMRIVEQTQGPPAAGDAADPDVDMLALMNKL